MALTARISMASDQIIHELVCATGKSKIDIIEEALKSYRFHERMRVLDETINDSNQMKNLGPNWKTEQIWKEL